MSDNQKDAFAERLRRIERNPGNGRTVEPGAAEAAPSKKRGKKMPVAKRQVFKKPRGGLAWLYGFATGAALFLAWISVYPAMSTPRSWALNALPVPPQVAGIAVAGILILGLGLLQRFSLRVLFLILLGMIMGALAICVFAAALPGLAAGFTGDTFANQMHGFVAPFLEE